MAGKPTAFRVAICPGKRRDLPDTPEGRLLDPIETAKEHIRAKGVHPFQLIKQQFGFRRPDCEVWARTAARSTCSQR